MKKFTMGFLFALLIISSLSVRADIKDYILHLVDYKVMVDGKEYTDSKHPILNYEDTTYVPMKKLADLLGADVNWNNESYQAEITSRDSINELSDNVSIRINECYQDKYDALIYNGSYYVYLNEIADKFNLKVKSRHGNEVNTQYYIINYNNLEIKIYGTARTQCIKLDDGEVIKSYVNVDYLKPILED